MAIIDSGQIIAIGTPTELKERSAGKSTVEVLCERPFDPALMPAWPFATSSQVTDNCRLIVVSSRPAQTLVEIIKWVEAQNLGLQDVHLSRPTLEDVFIELTGRRLRE